MSEQFKFEPLRQQRNAREQKIDDQSGFPKTETIERVSAEVQRLRKEVDELTREVDAVLRNTERPFVKAGALDKQGEPQTKEGGSHQAPPGRRRRRRGGGSEDDFGRVVRIHESIRQTLELLVKSKSPVPPELWVLITKSWPAADAGLQKAKAQLQSQAPPPKYRTLLTNAGFTGDMLELKEFSLDFHKKRIEKAVLTYNQKESLGEKVAKWLKPGFKVMNSILGSLSGIPGVEIAKEFKDHLESGYEAIEVGQPE